MTPSSGRLTALLLAAASLAPATRAVAQQQPRQQPLPRLQIERFAAPDGSRFVLVRDPDMAQVHWAIATWADGRDDPPGLPGLARVLVETSFHGTWQLGSADPDAERRVLGELDEAWQTKLARPGDATVDQRVVELDGEARRLGDTRTFRRVLAAAPVLAPVTLDRGPTAVVVMTTIAPALPEVARLVVERREQQALRRLPRAWMTDLTARIGRLATDPDRAMHAELLALLMPRSPAAAMIEQPAIRAPRRDQAYATWNASQYPTRTVHVLLGDLDPAPVRALLERAFATTALPAPAPANERPPQPPRVQRRSLVPSAPATRTTLGWVLPPLADPWTLEAGLRHLFDEERGLVTRMLARKRDGLTIRFEAPWPYDEQGRGLLRLDVDDPTKAPGLTDELIAACREHAQKDAPDGAYFAANVDVQRGWNEQADDPRLQAAALAARGLLWPDLAPTLRSPARSTGREIRAVLKPLFASNPAIVEGQR